LKEVSRVLCVFTRILGGKTFSKVLENHVNSRGYKTVTYVDYDVEIYKKYHPPFYFRLSDTLQSAWRINKKYKDSVSDSSVYDAIFFQAYDLALPFLGLMKKKYIVLSLDSTPLNAVRHNLKARSVLSYSRFNAVLTNLLNILFYKRIFRQVDVFLARTELVQRSLMDDYGIPKSKILVTYLPVDRIPSQINGKTSSRLNLLFAGNDWSRKGGEFLLDVFDETCADVAHLTIVSTDENVNKIPKRRGITVINGMPNAELISTMAQSDVFIFPSWKDELGLVLCEAVSQGIAVFARESGAQGEFVHDEVNGHLFGFSSTAEEWREAILSLAKDEDKLEMYKQNSLKLATQKLNPSRFSDQLRHAFPIPASTASTGGG
jgi:glycosyltransferase involved in cell wall biosynthesis